MFAELPKGLPKSRPTDHHIVVDETDPTPAHRLYRMPAADQEEIKRQVEEIGAAGRIRPSTSPFGASAMLRDKKDTSRRMVIDYRAPNKLARKDKYPITRIDEMLDKLATGKYFTKMDLSSGFHQSESEKVMNRRPPSILATGRSNGRLCCSASPMPQLPSSGPWT